jgi:CHAT domain-containing protein
MNRWGWLLVAWGFITVPVSHSDGAEVIVGQLKAPLRIGSRELTVEPGTRLPVIQTHGSYLLVEVEGRQGWIHRNHVRPPGELEEFGKGSYPLAAIVGRESPSVIRLTLERSPPSLIHNLHISGRDQEILDFEADIVHYATQVPINGTPLIGQLASVRAAHGDTADAMREFREIAARTARQLSALGKPDGGRNPFGDPRVSIAHILSAAGWCLANTGDPATGEWYLHQASDWIDENVPSTGSSILDERVHVWRADVALRKGNLLVAEKELSRAAQRRASYERFILAPGPGPQDPGLEGSGGYEEAVRALLEFANRDSNKSVLATEQALKQSLRQSLLPGKYSDSYLEIRVREKPEFQSGDNFDSTFPLNVALSVARRVSENSSYHDQMAEWLLNTKAMQEMALRTQLRAYREIAAGGQHQFSSLLTRKSPTPSLVELRVARGLVADFTLRHVAVDEVSHLRREFEAARAATLQMTIPRLPQFFVVPPEISKRYESGANAWLRIKENRDFDEIVRDKRAIKDWLDEEAKKKWVSAKRTKDHLTNGQVILTFAKYRDLDLEQLGSGYRWGNERYAAALLAAGRDTIYADLGPADEIDQEVTRIRESIASVPPKVRAKNFDEREETRKLRELMRPFTQKLLKPFLKNLESARELVLQPDGSLWLLPWQALPWSDSELFVDRFALQLSAGLRNQPGENLEPEIHVPEGAKSPAPPRGPPLLIGDPDFDLSTEEVRESELRLLERSLDKPLIEAARRGVSVLPEAEKLEFSQPEIEAIAPWVEKLTGETPRIFLGKDAIEGLFHKYANPRVLVMSTHGFFLAVPQTPDQRRVLPVRDPTMRCGLLLAGCNTRDQLPMYRETDGILTGYEASCLDLRDTEMVVLSACDTGVGSVKTFEGVRGLRHAFLAAGAESVVSTIWQVPDRDSQLIVSGFFERLADKTPRAEALRQAQLKRIQERRQRMGDAHPFFWAAWTVTE